ncbi:LacI family DNA-binding transcriptional regulator [Homoserinibacter sp. YIM 151385]|uniref:LacI family DNA-binding transcriptional regulator n=1 Tax=Homoserinibacter sp. YIM 151385 TaxID=2985506 RepID=UPI0022F134C5|nr:LacI family DNA-binding transcriptional regulator [Homoserinibacter sp. YIM 151385]WBU37969.1 LacI family DNA-binding transcriptional regulator [Homoserinibacter sp. YIM 151385]
MATVSRALNNRSEVSAATREKVVRIADELGYRPNASARALVRRRSDTIGLIWGTDYVHIGRRQPFLLDVLVGIKVALDSAGAHLAILSTGGDEQDFVRAAREHTIGGVVVMGVDSAHPGVASLLSERLPSVAFDVPMLGPSARYVTSDNRGGAGAAVDHLHELGHRRIATIAGPAGMHASDERLQGFADRAAGLGLALGEGAVQYGDFFLQSGYDAMRRLLELPERPTGVVVQGDEMAIGALHAIADAGLQAPRDISIVGFDDIESAALVRPALTTIAQDDVAIGAAILDELRALMDRGDGEEGVPEARLLPTSLVVRESTGPAPA